MKLNNVTELSAMFGETVSVQKLNGRLVIKNRPKRKRQPPTEKEIAHRAKVKAAAAYAKSISDNPELMALYATGIRKKHESAQSVAIGDFMNSPTVDGIEVNKVFGVNGNTILVDATDDFQVVKVGIIIADTEGVVIEQGEATKIEGRDRWEYKTAVSSMKGMKIAAVAYDRPGNQGSSEIIV